MSTVRDLRESSESAVRRRETLLVAAALLALLAVFFWRAVFLGEKLLPADIAYTDPLYFCHAPAEFTKPHNILLYDQAYQFYPWRVYVSRALRQGFLPLWDPYIYCGTPLLAKDQPALFYPLNILSYAFSPPDGVLLTALARLLIAGLSTYWFVRMIGGGRFGALLSAVSFAFSGFMSVWLGHPHSNVAAWLPTLFLAIEWLSRRNGVPQVMLVAVTVAVQLTGGHAETALYTLTAGGLYHLFRVAILWCSERKVRPALMRLLSFGAAAALGLALAAVHVLPFWEWLQGSAEFHLRSGSESLQVMRPGPRYMLAGLLPAVLPNIFNNPTWPGEYKSFLPGWNFVEQTVYVGILGLSLAASALFVRDHRNRVLFLAGVGLAALGAALRLPVFDWVNRLPLFDIASPGRWRLVYTFCMCVLVGVGAQGIVNGATRSSATRVLIRLLGGIALAAVCAVLVGGWILGTMGVGFPVTGIWQLSDDLVAQAFHLSNLGMYWPVLVALAGILVLVLYLRRVLSQKMVKVVLALLVIADMFAFGMNYHATIREEHIFPETPALQFVKNDQGIYRIVGTNIDVMPNTSVVHELYDVRGLDFPSHRYLEFCEAIGGQDWLGYGILFSVQLQPRLLGLLNVKYVLTCSRPGAKGLRDLRLLYVDRDINVYENLQCLPRSFVVHSALVYEDSDDILEALRDQEFDLRSEIILEKPLPPGFVASPGDVAQAATEITRYEPNHVTIEVATLSNGWLFLSDTYDSDWKAYVDGDETEIYRANYAFRAVYLEPGQHVVDFVYAPGAFKVGYMISLLALLSMPVMLVAHWRISRQRRGKVSDENASAS